MRRRGIVFVIGGTMAAALLVAVTRSSDHATKAREAEISDRHYALLADPNSFSGDRLEQVRQMLVQDGRITVAEFESLDIPASDPSTAKRVLLARLRPETVKGIFLHPHEPADMTGFSARICAMQPPRTQTEVVPVGATTYQLRGFHYCGSKRISGFTVLRDEVAINSVRHFGHASAEAFLMSDDVPLVFRTDLRSEGAYRLLDAFYDRKISDERFLRSILDLEIIATTADGTGG